MRDRDPVDAGFTLVEVLASLAVIGVVLTAVTTFFIRSMATVHLQGDRQAAAQVAATAMEQLREVPGAQALAWLTAHAGAQTATVGSVQFERTWDVPAPAALVTATVHVTWPSTDCPGGRCSFAASTLISTAGAEPVFDPATS